MGLLVVLLLLALVFGVGTILHLAMNVLLILLLASLVLGLLGWAGLRSRSS